MAAHNDLGKTGEQLSVNYLTGKGYTILHRNWRSGHKELDIVAQLADTLVIVEVKTRRNTEYGQPYDAVTNRKIRHIVGSADAYIRMFDIDLPHVRFDIITLTGSKENYRLQHIEEAFHPPVW